MRIAIANCLLNPPINIYLSCYLMVDVTNHLISHNNGEKGQQLCIALLINLEKAQNAIQ